MQTFVDDSTQNKLKAKLPNLFVPIIIDDVEVTSITCTDYDLFFNLFHKSVDEEILEFCQNNYPNIDDIVDILSKIEIDYGKKAEHFFEDYIFDKNNEMIFKMSP